MGKSDPTPQRFRRKAKSPSSSSGEQISNSLSSPPSTVDTLLCNNLLDSNITSELDVSPPEQPSQLSQGLTAANGTCDVELADSDVKGSSSSLVMDNGAVAADPAPREDDATKDFSSHLPAELSGLSRSEITPLCSNQSLEVSACHVQKDNSSVLVVFIYNSSDSDIQQILLELDSDELEVIIEQRIIREVCL